ncbi:hypothetical protein ACEQ6A_36465, partial [Rhizobium brockwellii]
PLTPSTYRSIYAISRRGEALNPKIAAVLDQLVRSQRLDGQAFAKISKRQPGHHRNRKSGFDKREHDFETVAETIDS